MDETFRQVEEHLRPWARGAAITPDTELYRDLGMYGDDLAFDVVLWAAQEFGMEGDFHLARYAPVEQSFHRLRLHSLVRKLLGTKARQYKSLKVSDVVAAIESKRWPD